MCAFVLTAAKSNLMWPRLLRFSICLMLKRINLVMPSSWFAVTTASLWTGNPKLKPPVPSHQCARYEKWEFLILASFILSAVKKRPDKIRKKLSERKGRWLVMPIHYSVQTVTPAMSLLSLQGVGVFHNDWWRQVHMTPFRCSTRAA